MGTACDLWPLTLFSGVCLCVCVCFFSFHLWNCYRISVCSLASVQKMIFAIENFLRSLFFLVQSSFGRVEKEFEFDPLNGISIHAKEFKRKNSAKNFR